MKYLTIPTIPIILIIPTIIPIKINADDKNKKDENIKE